jgi:CBS domain-containing protein
LLVGIFNQARIDFSQFFARHTVKHAVPLLRVFNLEHPQETHQPFERLIGIFTERDAVHRVLAKGLDPAVTRLADVMTTTLLTVAPNETFGYALLVMYENGFRHVPVVVDGKPVGIISARDALDPDLEEFASETSRRLSIRRFAYVM